MTTVSDAILRLLVAFARETADYTMADPEPGDLIIEVTGFRRPVDPDAIGWLIAHDQAPYNEDDPLDGSVPMREVWDVRPLNPNAKLQTIGGEQFQRWENAQFVKVADEVLEHAGITRPADLTAAPQHTA